MKWIEGCPAAELVEAHHRCYPDLSKLDGSEYRKRGTIDVNSHENQYGTEERFVTETIEVDSPDTAGLWLCSVQPHGPDGPLFRIGARLAHLRVHPVNKRVLAAIGFLREWYYLDTSRWGPGSKFLPVTKDGLPVDYQAQ